MSNYLSSIQKKEKASNSGANGHVKGENGTYLVDHRNSKQLQKKNSPVFSKNSSHTIQRYPNLDDKDLDASKKPEKIGADLTNLVYKMTYAEQAEEKLGGTTGYFKPKTPDNFIGELPVAYDDQLMGYTLASSQLSERLGLDILSKEGVARHSIEGEEMIGTVSNEVLNAAPMRQEGYAGDLNLRNKITQKGLSDLQLFDALTGQTDRRGENILIGGDGKVTGIDHEASFGYGAKHQEGSREFMEEPDLRKGTLKKYLGLPSQVDAGTAEKFLSLTPEKLREFLQLGGGYDLTEKDQLRAFSRLERVQKHLKSLKMNKQLVEKWGEETYRKSMEEQMLLAKDGEIVPRSYLARHELERRKENTALVFKELPGNAGLNLGDNHPRHPAPTPSKFLSEKLGVPIDQNHQHPIPRAIHRFWTGGKLSPAAFRILQESAIKSKGTGWSNTLWYSSGIEQRLDGAKLVGKADIEMRNLQRETLREHGYNVRPIEELAQDDPQPLGFFGKMTGEQTKEREPGRLTKKDMDIMAHNAVQHLVDRKDEDPKYKYEGIKHFSDMARLMYLRQEGGHHFDVDMGLGEMDLHRGYYHNDPAGNVPLLGTLTAESRDPISASLKELGSPATRDLADPQTEKVASEVALKALEMAQVLNGMMASRPTTKNLTSAVEYLRKEAIGPEGSYASGMLASKHLILGDDHNTRDVANEPIYAQTVPPYLFDLEHITDESDNR